MEESQSEEKSHEIRLQTKIKLRKRELEQKIFQSRLNSSNKKLVNHEELPMEAIEEPKETNEGFLPLNKCFRHNYRYKRERRCWKCGKTGHYKNRCPQIRCWYCGIKGHSKKRCFKRDLRIAINALKRMKDDGTRDKKPQKNKIDDRYKELEFIEKDNEIYMSSKGIDLAVYIGKKKFEWAKRGFEKPRIPRWKMEKPITTPVHVKKLKISDYLPHQCGSDGEVCDGHEFLTHCDTYHRGWCPEGSLVNASPFRYWMLWFDDANLMEFLDLSKKPQYKKADPPWFHSE